MALDAHAQGSRTHAGDVPLGEAAEWTAEASIRLAESWLELKLLEARGAARAALRGGALLAAALVAALAAWVAGAVAAALALGRVLPGDGAVACVAAAHLALAAACVALARRGRAGAKAR